MSDTPSRREELIAGALFDDLDDHERREFEQARAADPSMDTELEELRSTASRLNSAETTWRAEPPPPRLEGRILTATSDTAPAPEPGDQRRRRPRRRSRARSAPALLAAAAALLVLGGLGGGLVADLLDAPPTGPPGTAGVHEEIDFQQAPENVSIDGTLVAHTWGTETILEVDGFPTGETFEVVLTSQDGEEFASGTFFGAEETVECEMNAAVLREDVSEVRLYDETGAMIAASAVPVIDRSQGLNADLPSLTFDRGSAGVAKP